MKTRNAVTVVMALALLAGCSSDGADAPEQPTTEAASPPAPAAPTATSSPSVSEDRATSIGPFDDRSFTLVVRDTYPDTEVFTDEEIVSLATGTCARLDAGELYPTLLLELAQSDPTEQESSASVSVMVAGMLNYCPDRYAEVYPG